MGVKLGEIGERIRIEFRPKNKPFTPDFFPQSLNTLQSWFFLRGFRVGESVSVSQFHNGTRRLSFMNIS